MQVVIEDRAEQALRYLLPSEADHVSAVLKELENGTLDRISATHHIRQASDKVGQFFVLRATPKLRILFRYRGAQVLVEDIVSHEVLDRFFGATRL